MCKESHLLKIYGEYFISYSCSCSSPISSYLTGFHILGENNKITEKSPGKERILEFARLSLRPINFKSSCLEGFWKKNI